MSISTTRITSADMERSGVADDKDARNTFALAAAITTRGEVKQIRPARRCAGDIDIESEFIVDRGSKAAR